MTLEDTLETFRYFVAEADKLNLAYINLVRYVEMMDPVFDGRFVLQSTLRHTVEEINAVLDSDMQPTFCFVYP